MARSLLHAVNEFASTMAFSEHLRTYGEKKVDRVTTSLRNPMALRISSEHAGALPGVLARAAIVCGKKFDAARVGEALAGRETARSKLVRAAATNGLRVSAVTLPVAEAAFRSAEDAPLFALVGEGGYFSFEGIASGKAVVVDAHGDRHSLSFDLAANRLGLPDGAAEAIFLAFDPTFPDGEERDDTDEHHAHDAHHEKTPAARLRELLSVERADVWAIVVYGALVGLASLALPIAVQALVSSVAMGTMLQPVAVLTVVLTIVLSFSAGMRVAQVKLVELLQERLFVRAAVRLTTRFSRVTLDGFGGDHGPEQANRFMDVLTIQKAASGLLLDGLGIALQLVLGLALLAFYHPFLLAFDALLIGALLVVVFVLGRNAVPTAIAESKAKYGVVAWLEEISRHVHTFRSHSGRAFALERTDALLNEYLGARRRHFRILLRQVVGSLALHTGASAGVLGLGAVLVLQQQLTLGQLVAAEIVVNSVVAGIAKIGKHLESYYDLLAALDKVGHIEEVPTEREGGSAPEGTTPIGVSIEWHGQRIDVFPGERLAVRNGAESGGALLLDNLFAFRDDGAVRIDGVPSAELSLSAYREHVALVRGPEIFAGTVADNVRVGRKDITLADARRALRDVGLDETVAGLPKGIHSALSTYGAPLSPDESTRLVLARALAGRPRLLLLDGTLDGLSDHARTSMLAWLEAKRGDLTVILATNRADVESACDRAAFLGALEARG